MPASDRPPVKAVFFAFRIMLGDRLLHDRCRIVRRFSVVARDFVRDALVSARHVAMLVDWFRGCDFRLGCYRKRTPALARARHPAHSRCDLAGPGRNDCRNTWRYSCWRTASCSGSGIYYINRLIARGPHKVTAETRGRFRRARLPRRRMPGAKRCSAERVTPWNGISR